MSTKYEIVQKKIEDSISGEPDTFAKANRRFWEMLVTVPPKDYHKSGLFQEIKPHKEPE